MAEESPTRRSQNHWCFSVASRDKRLAGHDARLRHFAVGWAHQSPGPMGRATEGWKMHGERNICLRHVWSDAKLKLRLINQSINQRQSLVRIYDRVWDLNGSFQGIFNLRGLPEFLGLAVGSCPCPVPCRTKNPWNGSPNICARWPGPLWWSFLTTPLSWTRFAQTSFSHLPWIIWIFWLFLCWGEDGLKP